MRYPLRFVPDLYSTITILSLVSFNVMAASETNASGQSAASSRQVVGLGLDLAPMVGHVSSTNARIWMKSTGAAKLGLLISTNANLARAKRIRGPRAVLDSDFMGVVDAPNLLPSRRYYYCPLIDGDKALLPPYPSFQTAPPEGAPGRVRVAFISCLGAQGYDSAAAWGDMTRTNFDVLLMLGDNHYANSSDPKLQRAAYYDQRSVAGCKAITSTHPTYAIWDDHDFGPDNSDSTLKGKENSLKVFREHWANPAYGTPVIPGVFYKFTRGDVDFFMLDDRYYRTPNRLTNAPGRTMLGLPQLAWIKQELAASRAPVKILAAGSEWQSHGTSDGWASFVRERDDLLQFIRDRQIQGVVLLSGDRHFTAAYQVAGDFVEITSGPFGSGNARTKPLPEMFLYQGEGKVYCILDINTASSEPALTLEVYRAGDGRVQRRVFAWKEILGQQKIPPLPAKPNVTQ